MNTENICKALYALPGGVVTPRRQSIKTPVVVTLIGIALFIVNYTLVDSSHEVLSMSMLTAAVACILYGVVVIMVRLNSQKEVPYDNEAGGYMKYRERYYDRQLVSPLRKAIECGDTEAIDSMPTTNIAAVTLVEYRSSRRRAYAIYEYGEAEYQPLSEPVILDK